MMKIAVLLVAILAVHGCSGRRLRDSASAGAAASGTTAEATSVSAVGSGGALALSQGVATGKAATTSAFSNFVLPTTSGSAVSSGSVGGGSVGGNVESTTTASGSGTQAFAQGQTVGTGVGKNSFFNSLSTANAKAVGGLATGSSAVNTVSDIGVTGSTVASALAQPLSVESFSAANALNGEGSEGYFESRAVNTAAKAGTAFTTAALTIAPKNKVTGTTTSSSSG